MDLEWLHNYTTPVEENEIYKPLYTIDFDKWFINQIKVFLNCTKTMKSGQRLIQTNDFRYKNEMSITVESIKRNINEEYQEKYFNILKLRHELNLRFESKHGFNYEIRKKKQTKDKSKKINKSKKNKQLNMPLDSVPYIDLSKIKCIVH